MDRVRSTSLPLPVRGPLESDRDEVDLTPVRTYWQLVRMRFIRHRLAVIGLLTMLLLITLAIVIPLATGDSYQKTSLDRANGAPSLEAPLGYDSIGQNIFVRLMRGLQTSLLIAFMSVGIIIAIGVPAGTLAGYAGGRIDAIIMRIVDVVLSLPTFFLIVMLVAFFGTGNPAVVIMAIGFTGWTLSCRLVRAEFLRLREADYVQAARALGASGWRIAVRHMLPSAIAPVVVAGTLAIADSVVTEAALSFLGFGISPPEASLGNMLTRAQDYFFRQPLLVVYPGVLLIIVVLAASFLGDGLRDALDPRQRVKE